MKPFHSAPLFLALRYLRPKRSFVSVITLISVLGVMLGVGVLVVVMSVFKGWQWEFKKLLLGFEPHMVLVQQKLEEPENLPPGVEPLPRTRWAELLKKVKETPGLVAALPVAEGTVALRFDKSDPEPAELMGMRDTPDNALLAKLQKHLVAGSCDLKGDNIIITDKLAKKLNVKPGDVLSVLARQTVEQMIRDMRAAEEEKDPEKAAAVRDEIVVLPKDLTVVGVLRADTAQERCYAPLHLAQELFNLESDVSGIEIELADPDSANPLAYAWMENGLLPPDWRVRTWESMYGYKLQDVENQKSLLYFILLFVMLVAAICVMNTTITVTVQKRREIGILTALGTRVSQIVGIFLTHAGIVAVLGVVLGLAGGMTFLQFRNTLRNRFAELTGRDIFPQDIYFLSEIPARVESADLVGICGLAVVLCLLAALLPAWIAARVDPAVALRN